MEPTEAQIQKAILDYLKLAGHFAVRINTQGVPMWNEGGRLKGFRKSPMVGVSDILGVQKNTGRFFAIEVKKKGGVVSPEQTTFIQEVQKRGGIGMVAYSLDDVTNIL